MVHENMTQIPLKMPRLGETMEQGTIVEWLVNVGKTFKRGDPILEVETDKTVVEFPALGDGVLIETLAQPGDIIDVGQSIATIDVINAKDWDEGRDEIKTPTPVQEEIITPPEIPSPTSSLTQSRDKNAPIRATPPARLFARQSHIPLQGIVGSGRRGRIELSDVMDAQVAAQTLGSQTYLLIHGFAGDASTWAQLEASLKRAGHSVHAPDLPGHGTDNSQATTPEEFVEDMKCLARTLPQPLHIIGHSLGAWVGANIATLPELNIASLTLVAPLGAGQEISTDFIYGMAKVQNVDSLRELLRQLSPKSDTLSTDALTKMLKSLIDGKLSALANNLVGPKGQTLDILSPLADVPPHIPISAIIGTNDQIIPPAHAMNMPMRVSVHFLPTGHMPHWDVPSEIAQLILDKSTRQDRR